MVQAVSQHRQRRPGDAAVSMLNLISAYRAQPEQTAEGGAVGAVQWGEREELKDLYGIFCAKVRGGSFHRQKLVLVRIGVWHAAVRL